MHPVVSAIQEQLNPKFETLLENLSNRDDRRCFTFFDGCSVKLSKAQNEEDVLLVFFELANAAFLGFHYDAETWNLADDLLATAEQLAFTMTAQDAMQ